MNRATLHKFTHVVFNGIFDGMPPLLLQQDKPPPASHCDVIIFPIVFMPGQCRRLVRSVWIHLGGSAHRPDHRRTTIVPPGGRTDGRADGWLSGRPPGVSAVALIIASISWHHTATVVGGTAEHRCVVVVVRRQCHRREAPPNERSIVDTTGAAWVVADTLLGGDGVGRCPPTEVGRASTDRLTE